MKLIAPQDPRTVLFSNLLQPEIEKKTQQWKKADSRTDTEGTTGGDVSSLSERQTTTTVASAVSVFRLSLMRMKMLAPTIATD